MRRGVWVCMALALALHGAWLAQAYPRLLDRAMLPSPQGLMPRAMATRTVPGNGTARDHPAPAPASPRAPAPVPPAPEPAPGTRMEADRPTSDAAPTRGRATTAPDPEPAASVPWATDSVDPDAPQFESAASEPVDDDPDDRYLPRRALTRAPVALDGVRLSYPRIEFGDGERHSSILSLFIDEAGRVVRVRVDGPPLPEVLEGVARRAFQRVRYSPGEVDGQAVPALIRVEVTFDRLTIPAP